LFLAKSLPFLHSPRNRQPVVVQQLRATKERVTQELEERSMIVLRRALAELCSNETVRMIAGKAIERCDYVGLVRLRLE